jgi:hypothetical protein
VCAPAATAGETFEAVDVEVVVVACAACVVTVFVFSP